MALSADKKLFFFSDLKIQIGSISWSVSHLSLPNVLLHIAYLCQHKFIGLIFNRFSPLNFYEKFELKKMLNGQWMFFLPQNWKIILNNFNENNLNLWFEFFYPRRLFLTANCSMVKATEETGNLLFHQYERSKFWENKLIKINVSVWFIAQPFNLWNWKPNFNFEYLRDQEKAHYHVTGNLLLARDCILVANMRTNYKSNVCLVCWNVNTVSEFLDSHSF